MKKIFITVKVFLLIISFCLMPADLFATEQIKVVVSIYPLYDITKQIGKDRINVKTLLPPAASEHTYEPTPKQIMEIHGAEAFIKIGAGLEFWAEKFVKAASNKKLKVVDLSVDMPLIYGIHNHEHKHESKGRQRHKAEVADPHYWLDPVLAKKIVDRITDTLIQIDPQNKKFYLDNAEQYKKELEKLHEEITEKVKQFKIKEYVTHHSAWNYFSKRYGLKVIGAIIESPGREPSPAHIARIIKELKRLNARIIFAEPQFNPKVAEAIAKEANAKVLLLDPLGAPDTHDRDTYIKLMRYNISQMEMAMK